MRKQAISGLALALLAAEAPRASAAIYLVGGINYGANPTTGADVSTPAELDTFPFTANSKFTIGGSNSDISVLLPVGTTTLSLGAGFSEPDGFGLFFSPNSSGTFSFGQAPDLDVVDPNPATTTFFVPAAGTLVGSVGQYSESDPANHLYSGATSFTIGSQVVSVIALTSATQPNIFTVIPGSITFQVANVPEPTSSVFVGAAALLLRRRRGV